MRAFRGRREPSSCPQSAARARHVVAYMDVDTRSHWRGEARELGGELERACYSGGGRSGGSTRPGTCPERVRLAASASSRRRCSLRSWSRWICSAMRSSSGSRGVGVRTGSTMARADTCRGAGGFCSSPASRSSRACSWRLRRRSRRLKGFFCSMARQLKDLIVVPRELRLCRADVGSRPPTNTRSLEMMPASRNFRRLRATDSG